LVAELQGNHKSDELKKPISQNQHLAQHGIRVIIRQPCP